MFGQWIRPTRRTTRLALTGQAAREELAATFDRTAHSTLLVAAAAVGDGDDNERKEQVLQQVSTAEENRHREESMHMRV